MLTFEQFKARMQAHVNANVMKMVRDGVTIDRPNLFISDVSKDDLWDTYLGSFPPGSNPIFRERTAHDCNYCKQYVRRFSNVVGINDDLSIVTVWDFETGDVAYQVVIDAMARLVRSAALRDMFLTTETGFGIDRNHELADDAVHVWSHLRVDVPPRFIARSGLSVASVIGTMRDTKGVFRRSLEEISETAINDVLDLITQGSLYKGEEWKSVLGEFLLLHKTYHRLPDEKKEAFCWVKSVALGGALTKIKNHSIGTLLVDITEEMDIDEAVRRYEKVVAPDTYMRPKPIFSKRMAEDAVRTITQAGLLDSLPRRHATLDDINVGNILYVDRDVAPRVGGLLDDLVAMVPQSEKQFDRVEEVSIARFVENVLPTLSHLEVWVENRHEPNLVSLIAPKLKGSPSLFKWDNGFSWAYNGNITDSMKQRVKSAGGNVDGVLRCSLQWNEEGDNHNDFDLHCVEPKGNHIWFSNKGHRHLSTGMLDVDIIHPAGTQVAVENITWTDLDKMKEGTYHLYVHNYTQRDGRSGFRAEIEYNGTTHAYDYPHAIRQGAKITIARFEFSRKSGIRFLESLDSTTSSKSLWGVQSNQFCPVSVAMFSPNFWDGQSGIGHRHYFFMLNGCKNMDSPNGFFNEFLRPEFAPHKRAFEALGSKMRAEPTEDQLSGLGFSSTQRNDLIVKLQGQGNFQRTIKLLF